MNPRIAKQIKQFKEENKDKAIMALWKDFQPLVIHLMGKYYIARPDQEDVKQEAFIQLLECANKFDQTLGIPFEAYFKTYLNYWFLNRIRKKTELVVIDSNWQEGFSMSDLIRSTLGNAPELAEENELIQTMENTLESLTNKQRQVIVSFYLKNIPLTYIAKKMGCSYNVAYKHKAAGLRNMKKNWKL